MAAPRKILVLDLGMQSLRLAEFSASQTGELTLIRGARREFLLDPALDTSRPGQIKLSLKEILKEWKLKSGDVTCVLPSHTVFTRVVPLDVPGGLEGKIDVVARFEAQQNIPFPLEEVIWDYIPLGTNPTGAVNVAFLAIKTDTLESLCRAVSDSGLNITSVTVAPLALYDAYRHTTLGQSDDPSLLLDFGSHSTNMLVASPSTFFCRSIPTGGMAITTAVAKEIHVDLDEAENLKVSRGSVALGPGFEPPADPVEANLGRIARQSLLKIQADITRSLGYYRTTLGGTEPIRVLISGGMVAMPYLTEFLIEKLQKECQIFSPLDTVLLTEQGAAFAESNPGNIAELVGGALEFFPGSRTAVNLLPPTVAQKHDLSRRLPYFIATAAILLVTIIAWSFYAHNAAEVTRQETSKISVALTNEGRLDTQFKQLQKEELQIVKKGDDLLSIINLRQAYPNILAELTAKVPARFLWITEIQMVGVASQKPGQPKAAGQPAISDAPVNAIVIKGLYLDNPRQAAVIDDFVTALQSSDVFVVDEKEKSKIITQRGSPNMEFWAYPFSLRIPLRNSITPLP
jgi:type IV pilus assembly protein PilM